MKYHNGGFIENFQMPNFYENALMTQSLLFISAGIIANLSSRAFTSLYHLQKLITKNTSTITINTITMNVTNDTFTTFKNVIAITLITLSNIPS